MTAEPAVLIVWFKWDGANVLTHVASHKRQRPLRHGTNVRPSGLLPSVRHRPGGSKTQGTLADTKARLLLLLLLYISPSLESTGCDVCINDVCYGKDQLFESLSLSTAKVQIDVDRAENILYYVDRKDGDLKSLNLTDNTVKTVRVGGAWGISVDQDTRDLYINYGDNKIIKYNPATNQTSYVPINLRVKQLLFKKKLYALSMSGSLNTIEDGEVKTLDVHPFEYIRYFIMDKAGDIYYRQSGLKTYKIPVGSNSTVFFTRLSKYVLATDNNDTAYFFDQLHSTISNLRNGDNSTSVLEQVGVYNATVFNELFYVQFDKYNNMIVVDSKEQRHLHYLTANSGRCDSVIQEV